MVWGDYTGNSGISFSEMNQDSSGIVLFENLTFSTNMDESGC